MTGLILSLFPGIGLLDRAFEEVGFCVVRGPDVLWGGDVKTFHPPAGVFAGIIGGPPCQPFSRLQHIVKLNRERNPGKYELAENLIPEYVRCIQEAKPTWWLMENVPDVPVDEWPSPGGYFVHRFLLNNRWVVETTPQNRERCFWFGHQKRCIDLRIYMEFGLFEPIDYEYAVMANGSSKTRPVALGSNGKPKRLPKNRGGPTRSVEECARLQGLPEDFLADSPFTAKGKRQVVGNGIPLPMGRSVARAVRGKQANQTGKAGDVICVYHMTASECMVCVPEDYSADQVQQAIESRFGSGWYLSDALMARMAYEGCTRNPCRCYQGYARRHWALERCVSKEESHD